jgi:hypothetical protein
MFTKAAIIATAVIAFSLNSYAQIDSQSISNTTVPAGTVATQPISAPSVVSQDTIAKNKSKFFYQGVQLKTNKAFLDILKSNPAAESKYRSATALGYVGLVLGAVGGVLIGSEIGSAMGARMTDTEREGNPGMYVGGGIAAGVGIIIGVVAQTKARSAISDYNKKVQNNQSSADFVPDYILVSSNSAAVVWNF